MPDSKPSRKNIIEHVDSKVVEEARLFVYKLLENQLPEIYLYHTLNHTKEVLKYVEIIGEFYDLSENEMNIVRLNALFHDTGYIRKYKDHEYESIQIAKEFLRQKQIGEMIIEIIAKSIMATKVPQNPVDIYSEILCDADLVNLTYDNYFEVAELLRQEWKNSGFASLSEKEFHLNSINFFEAHHYHTEYGKRILAPKKADVLKQLKARVELL